MLLFRREKKHYEPNILLQKLKSCLIAEDEKMVERCETAEQIISILSSKYGDALTALKTEVSKICNHSRPTNFQNEEKSLANIYSILCNLETAAEKQVFTGTIIQKILNSNTSKATAEKKEIMKTENEVKEEEEERILIVIH